MKIQMRAMPPLKSFVVFHRAIWLYTKSFQRCPDRGVVEPRAWNDLCHLMIHEPPLADDNLSSRVRSSGIFHTLFPNESKQERINIVPRNC